MSLRLIEQGRSIYVLGTDQIAEASHALPADVVGWARSEVGTYARRVSVEWCSPLALDAEPGVRFSSVDRGAEHPSTEGADRG